MRVFPVQIRLEPDGPWHRRLEGNGGHHTACGLDFGTDLVPATRNHVLDDKICPECHVEYERKTGAMKALKKEQALYPDDMPESKRGRRRSPRDTERDIVPGPPNGDDTDE